ncbi:hypothetical protein ER308_07205 [Egibacter rhizosphaerae]|uniref:Uncharacterized protein n=1 Tax=Egibacter rhizosphaerae TaxID=1670831 RepID=A0A411YDQ2_9ACTN|nr:hypothetical protein [Egibacter rhizosphaerae]QBI19353.1 hypothetical protein ER308_07205 [Egibacter rhizosphaerae]
MGELLDRAEWHLTGGLRAERNRLAAPLSTSDGEVELEFPVRSLAVGEVLEVGRELMYVWRADPDLPQPVAEVERGFRGSPVESHFEAATVRRNPRAPRHVLWDSMLRELRELSGTGLLGFEATTKALSGDESVVTLEPEGNHAVLGVYDVRPVSGKEARIGWRVIRKPDPDEHGSGAVVRVWGAEGKSVRIIYTRGFSEFTSESDDVQAVCGVPDYAEEVLEVGAARRVPPGVMGELLQRDTARGPRDAQEMQAGGFFRQQVDGLYRRAVSDALAAQAAAFPPGKAP